MAGPGSNQRIAAASASVRGVTAAGGTTKARIERAAIGLFAQHGVDAVTTREIAAASGVSEGALYRHFPGKEALALALFLAIHKRLAEDIRAAAFDHDAIEDQARAVVGAYCQAADDDWPLFSYHLLTTHRYLPSPSRPEISDRESPVSAVEAIVESAMRAGVLPAGDPKLKAAMALGVVLQAALHKFYGRIEGALGLHRPALTSAVIAVLKS